MTQSLNKIVIVGGGTAGWITAALLAAEHRARAVNVTLIESPDIPTIGVGEGTWPSMRMTLQKIGLPEADLIRDSEASFKQGTRFVDWATGAGDQYYHPFSLPLEYSSLNLAEFWLADCAGTDFSEFVTPQAGVISEGLAPKQVNTPQYAFNVNYGYHFDAGKFATQLHRHAVDNLGVNFVSANVRQIERDKERDNDIAAVILDSGERIAGDLFIDCTGQRAMLIGQHLGVGLKPLNDVLFNDRAIAVQVPYERDDSPINSTTHSTAQAAGWVWDIGLQTRRGIGYVHSSAHADEETAMETLAGYISTVSPATDVGSLSFRTILFAAGHRESFWVGNCVAVGLSAGFVEPLEASAIALIEQSAAMISQQLPQDREIMSVVARRFNEKMGYHWEKIVEFLKLHYVLSQRDDSDYWRECRNREHWPVNLRDKLMLWEQQPPWHDDAPRVDELFPSASYQYVLYGMGFRPRYQDPTRTGNPAARARVESVQNALRQRTREFTKGLPSNRQLIDALVQS